MDELSERLRAVLSSPEDMDRLARMAQQLMGQIAPPPETQGGGNGGDMLSLIRKVTEGMNGGKQQLLAGMSPYLSPGRRSRLERALRLASAARLAGYALGETGGSRGD